MENSLDHLIYMKFGYHALETENVIIKRKKLEFEIANVMFWGYGGTVCHPINQVKPFAKWSKLQNKKIYLAMSFTPSKPSMDGTLRREYSTDGMNWHSLPNGIRVTGSKYAIVCNELLDVDIDIDLSKYSVALGPSQGKPASDYIKFRVDKGCIVKSGVSNSTTQIVKIKLIAEVKNPYAVLVR